MAVALTSKAAHKVKRILSRHRLPETAALRIGIKGGGCRGFSYTLDVVDHPTESDQEFESNGVRIVVDSKSLLYLDGTELDYDDTLLKGGFVFRNPNAKSRCGCGASFST